MNDNSNNVHFSGVRFICSPYLTDNGQMRAANESYALKMNIIVILLYSKTEARDLIGYSEVRPNRMDLQKAVWT